MPLTDYTITIAEQGSAVQMTTGKDHEAIAPPTTYRSVTDALLAGLSTAGIGISRARTREIMRHAPRLVMLREHIKITIRTAWSGRVESAQIRDGAGNILWNGDIGLRNRKLEELARGK